MRDIDRGPNQNPAADQTPRYPGLRTVSLSRLEAAAKVRAQRDRDRGATLSVAGAERRSRTLGSNPIASEVRLVDPQPSLGEE